MLAEVSSNDVLEAIRVGRQLVEIALSGKEKDTVVLIRIDHLAILTACASMWVTETK